MVLRSGHGLRPHRRDVRDALRDRVPVCAHGDDRVALRKTERGDETSEILAAIKQVESDLTELKQQLASRADVASVPRRPRIAQLRGPVASFLEVKA
jgi:hypothetical protein